VIFRFGFSTARFYKGATPTVVFSAEDEDAIETSDYFFIDIIKN